MQVELITELALMKANTPNGMYSVISGRLNQKGIKATRFTVKMELCSIKATYDEAVLKEAREVFTLLTGLKFEKEIA